MGSEGRVAWRERKIGRGKGGDRGGLCEEGEDEGNAAVEGWGEGVYEKG